jgi:hypothetical protein
LKQPEAHNTSASANNKKPPHQKIRNFTGTRKQKTTLNNRRYNLFYTGYTRTMRQGFIFKKYTPPEQTPFERLFEIFTELITHTSGDFDEAIEWLRTLDKEYKLTTPDYTIDDFIDDLRKKRYIRDAGDKDGKGGGTGITEKMERVIRQAALEQIFGDLKRSGAGNHRTKHSGNGDEHTGEFRQFNFGDALERISMTETLRNAQVNNGVDDFQLQERDLVVEDSFFKAQMSTVLMIDISHSMILYGEDRITPAKKVAMALAELIKTRYPKDTLDILVFGDDAWPHSAGRYVLLQLVRARSVHHRKMLRHRTAGAQAAYSDYHVYDCAGRIPETLRRRFYRGQPGQSILHRAERPGTNDF